MERFEAAFKIASMGHRNQLDKAGEPYIKHLMRVAGTVPKDCMVVAILHDYFEDVVALDPHKNPLEEIPRYAPFLFLTDEEVYALYLLTRTKELTYRFYIERLEGGMSEIATRVKIADINDHLDHGANLEPSLLLRYANALDALDPPD